MDPSAPTPPRITRENPYAEIYDLSNCDQEPIHVIQTIQSFACVLAVDPQAMTILQCSDNSTSFLNRPPEAVVGQPLDSILPTHVVQQVLPLIASGDFSEINPVVIPVTPDFPQPNQAIFHSNGEMLLVEIELNSGLNQDWRLLHLIDKAIQQIQSPNDQDQLFQTVAEQVRKITKYDRVMIYQFDKDYNGEVIAEVHAPDQEPFLGLHYPASDIPRQARKLYLTNRVRIIADVDDPLSLMYPSVHPTSGQALDISHCASRGVSPIHLEYLRNMGVQASLSVAIVEAGKLWGLIACHHSSPMPLGYRIRSLIQFMGQIISGHLSLSRATLYRSILLQNNQIHAKLFEYMTQERDIVKGLIENKPHLLDYIPAAGVVLSVDDQFSSKGEVPPMASVEALTQWLQGETHPSVYQTNQAATEFPEFDVLAPGFAGVLAISLSTEPAEFIIWFRKAQTFSVDWGGNPDKALLQGEVGKRLSPRKSFAKWQQVVKNLSLPWEPHEVEAAILLRNDIKEILQTRFHELRRLNEDLRASYKSLESFSYSVSHDLRSPLRRIDGFANILLEDYADKLDSYGLEVIQTIVQNVEKMNTFINDTLELAKLAKKELSYQPTDIQAIIEHSVDIHSNNSPVPVHLTYEAPLASVLGDKRMLYQLFDNLIANAIKYSAPKGEVYLKLGFREEEKYLVYSVSDNGIGFNMAYKEKIYEVFSRLVGENQFEGTGIGLSIVKRIVERHRGKIEVESTEGVGTKFWVYLPKRSTKHT